MFGSKEKCLHDIKICEDGYTYQMNCKLCEGMVRLQMRVNKLEKYAQEHPSGFSVGEIVDIGFSGRGTIRSLQETTAMVTLDGTEKGKIKGTGHVPISSLKKIEPIKKLEENKMKHPCGKEFDLNKKIDFRNWNREIIDILKVESIWHKKDKNLKIIFKHKNGNDQDAFPYFPCGHFNVLHSNSEMDLINLFELKKEKKEIEVNKTTEMIKNFKMEIAEMMDELICQINDVNAIEDLEKTK